MIYNGRYLPDPKYATPRDPSAPTDGRAIGKIARALGKPFMPWQELVADVAGEHEPNGDLRYEIVFVTVPRQSGKTTLVGPVQMHTCITTPDIKVFYTAQTGKDASARWMDLVKLIKRSPLAAIADFRYSAGSQAIEFPNGSTLSPFAPVDGAIHGETPPKVTLDEIWKYTEAQGDYLVEDAIIPAQMTLAGRRQIWMISTAGTALSVFMKKWVTRGRNGGRSRMAYFEWSLHDGDDPYDPEALKRFHPAIGHTVTVEELLAIGTGIDEETGEQMDRAKWLRGFCNTWTEALDPVMAAEDWDALAVAGPAEVPSRRDIAVTYEVAPDNETGSVMASWRDSNGSPCIRVLHTAPGTTWMLPLLLEIKRDWKPAVMGADDGGPTRRLTDELRRTLDDYDAIVTTGSKDYGTACDALLTYARDDKTLVQDGSLTLSNAVAHLVLKRVNDYQRFDRTASTGPIAGFSAAAVGLWLFDHKEQALGKPEIYI